MDESNFRRPAAAGSGRGVDEPTVVLGHLADTRYGFFVVGMSRSREFETFSHRLRRPSEGSDLVELRCDECDQRLYLSVRSVEGFKRVRRRYLWTAIAAAVVSLGSVAAGFGLEYLGYFIPLATPLGTGMLLAFLLGGLVAGVVGYLWWGEDGIRLYSEESKSEMKHWRLDSARPRKAQTA